MASNRGKGGSETVLGSGKKGLLAEVLVSCEGSGWWSESKAWSREDGGAAVICNDQGCDTVMEVSGWVGVTGQVLKNVSSRSWRARLSGGHQWEIVWPLGITGRGLKETPVSQGLKYYLTHERKRLWGVQVSATRRVGGFGSMSSTTESRNWSSKLRWRSPVQSRACSRPLGVRGRTVAAGGLRGPSGRAGHPHQRRSALATEPTTDFSSLYSPEIKVHIVILPSE